jgi:regulator of ribonuclease activity A
MNFSTSDLCDEFPDNVRVLNSDLKPYGGLRKVMGRVVTIKLDEDNSDLITLLKQPVDGHVAVVDVEAKFCAVVGDTLMGYAHTHGWSGMIINGYVRDIHNTSSIDVGLWALGTCPKKSRKKAEGILTQPVQFGDIVIHDGDYIFADEDGIIVSDKNLLDASAH